MKKNIILFASMNIAVVLFGYNGNSDKTQNNSAPENDANTSKIASESTSCYVLENGKDTVSLKMTIDKNQVSGDLLYHYFEKDRNTGTIAGQMKGDTLFATYTFMSEGLKSKREIAFLRKGDELMEGYADINPGTREPDFTNHSEIKFDQKFILHKSDCQ